MVRAVLSSPWCSCVTYKKRGHPPAQYSSILTSHVLQPQVLTQCSCSYNLYLYKCFYNQLHSHALAACSWPCTTPVLGRQTPARRIDCRFLRVPARTQYMRSPFHCSAHVSVHSPSVSATSAFRLSSAASARMAMLWFISCMLRALWNSSSLESASFSTIVRLVDCSKWVSANTKQFHERVSLKTDAEHGRDGESCCLPYIAASCSCTRNVCVEPPAHNRINQHTGKSGCWPVLRLCSEHNKGGRGALHVVVNMALHARGPYLPAVPSESWSP